MASFGEKILSYHDVLLRESDVELLDGPYWLNDAIITFWMQFMEHELYQQHSPSVAFVTPDVVHFVKSSSGSDLAEELKSLELQKKDVVLLPVNDCACLDSPGGCHWSLLVYSRKDGKFAHYDSSKGTNLEHAQRVAKALLPVLNAEVIDLVEVQCPQQKNSYDCGVHVIYNLDRVCQKYMEDCQDNTHRLALKNDMEQNRHILKRLVLELAQKSK
ncbi:sentrin-specific protease 8-like [Ornithodoros turicata]|uniref:sentrin-specific protease 8-like n=1 Tax=Ornithodoros turicata TaxID=34597 RepID=UPI00313A2311